MKSRAFIPLRDTQGSVLAPCLFMLSLMALLALGTLYAGGVGNSSAGTLAESTQARMAAQSGLQIAYQALTDNNSYTGQNCTPLAGSACTVEITVTDLGDSEFEVFSHATQGDSDCLIRTRACLKPFALYPLTVGNDIYLKGNSKILGECFLQGDLWGKDASEITGNVFFTGEREITYNSSGDPIMIGIYPAPKIGGEVICNAPPTELPEVNLAGLRNQAAAAGQVYSGTNHFTDMHFDGVVYIEGSNSRPYFKDVTIDGILVCDGVTDVRIEGGFFKIHCDENICENVAILAPDSFLWVDPNALIDVYGLSLFSSTDFQGSGTFTGPLVVTNNLLALPDSFLYCQFPVYMEQFFDNIPIWENLKLVELEYEEM